MTTDKPPIPPDTQAKWQRVVDLVAELTDVPAALIMATVDRDHRVKVSNSAGNTPYYPGRTYHLNEKLYCFGVFEADGELVVEDARCEPRWRDNEDMEHAMSFYIGYPIKWPDGEVYGTICVLDTRRNKRALMFRKGLQEFCRVVEGDLALLLEVAQRKQAQAELRETVRAREDTIRRRTEALEDANTALRVLIDNVEASRHETEQQIVQQIKGMVLPYIAKLRHLDADRDLQSAYLLMIEDNLKNITSALSSRLAETLERLTPAETEIMQLIMMGRTTKEIAAALGRGTSTIDFHRNNIRQKLGLSRRENLRQHLIALSSAVQHPPRIRSE
ncbi:LuxR C-terminal-related transcriptional regulator [Leisingera aquimarina]|uniref:LuxR C-terminal-related transcriptional regulator n=1 Tax=Leisingera aquimarina TaxID=476529 RepID=UPI0003FF68AA|nr:LuxR C-terminal-related transcriptional regulator [Leisingera aquimarina]